ncbi:MAG: hypothetical protein ACRDSG_02455 [Pseudonocardiaceae bacterium]
MHRVGDIMPRLLGKQLTALTALVLGLVVTLGGPVRLAAGSGIGGHTLPGVVADQAQIVSGPAAQQPVVRMIGQAPVPVGAVPAALLVAVLFFWCLARRGGRRLPAASLVRRQRGRSPPGVPISRP